jgi:tRNA-specific 2-thiouridylase
MRKRARVIVGMSGGVDSSVTAFLLKQAGYEVIGLFMKNWEEDGYCPVREDFLDAISVADQIGIDFEWVNCSRKYQEQVFSGFLEEIRQGRTPNPDVQCNTAIKFDVFSQFAKKLDADFIATGHYAALQKSHGKTWLMKAKDGNKDQTYFLARTTAQQLESTLFPLGNYLKSEVRAIARSAGLCTHAKKDSTGICFVGERPFKTFLKHYITEKPGPIMSLDGRLLGQHDGLMYYTIGQRKGLGIGGEGEPWFVAAKDVKKNILWVVQGRSNPALYSRSMIVTDPVWITMEPLPYQSYTAKIRYRQAESLCWFEWLEKNRMLVHFNQPQWAATPGQVLVLYDGNVCLGGAMIESTQLMQQPHEKIMENV